MRGAKESNLENGAPPQNTGGCIGNFWNKYLKVDPAWLKEIRGHLITASALTAAMAYQSILSPPGSFWQDTKPDKNAAPSPANSLSADENHTAGQAILDSNKDDLVLLFLWFNTTALGASFSTIMLAMTGFPPANKFLAWLSVLTVFITISCMTLAYVAAALAVFPNQFSKDAAFGVTVVFLTGWTSVLVLHSCRFLVWLWKKLVKLVSRKP